MTKAELSAIRDINELDYGALDYFDEDLILSYVKHVVDNSKLHRFFEDNYACLDGKFEYYEHKTIEAALKAIVQARDVEAIEWYLCCVGVEDNGDNDPLNYTAKQLIALLPKKYQTNAPKRKSR